MALSLEEQSNLGARPEPYRRLGGWVCLLGIDGWIEVGNGCCGAPSGGIKLKLKFN